MSKQALKDPKIRTGFGRFLSVFNQDAELYRGLSEELKSELANTQSELQTRMNILETASIMSEADLKGNITYVNDKFCEVTGYTREEVMGQPHNILRHPDMPAETFKDMWGTIGRGHVWNGIVKNKRKDGSPYWVNATVAPVLGENGKPVKYVSVRFDITQQVKAELDLQSQLETLQQQEEEIRQTAEQIQQQDEELRQNLEELNAMNEDLSYAQMELRAQINALNNAAIVSETDVKGNITYVNDMFCQISGYSREELLGNNHRIVKSDVQDDQFWKDFWKTIANGQVWRGVICNKAKDGSHYWVGTTVTPVLNNEGKPVRYIGVRFDITQQKEQEIAIERMRSELAQAKTLVEEELSRANDQLRDSVVYAQRMLRAILPSESDLNAALPAGWEAGLFFQPRDVVGGDFYWIGRYKNRLVLATGDSTGHGVPGSFLSIIGVSSLRKLVEERGITTPAELLEELDSDVQSLLRQEAGSPQHETVQDSIEMNVLQLNTDGSPSAMLANAMRPALLMRGGEAIELKPVKRSVGGTIQISNEAYTGQEVQFQPGDTLVLFSDGLSDQQGGPGDGNRKLGKGGFLELMRKVCELERMKDRTRALHTAFTDWKGFFRSQNDDIMVIMLRYKG